MSRMTAALATAALIIGAAVPAWAEDARANSQGPVRAPVAAPAPRARGA